MFTNALAVGPHDPQRVGLVDHQKHLVLVLQLDKARQVRVVAVHAVDAFEHHQHPLEMLALIAQQTIEGFDVVVSEAQATRAGQLDALQHTVVDKFVVDHQVPRAKQVADGGDVGGMPTDEGHGVIHLVQPGQFGFQLAMDRPVAGHQAAGRYRRAVVIDGRLGRLGDHRMPGIPQVVVAGEVDEALTPDRGFGARQAFVQLEERIGQAKARRAVMHDPQLLVTGMLVEAVELLRHRPGIAADVRQRRRWRAVAGLPQAPLQGLLDQLVFHRSAKP
ncbi:hypothetical protein D9M71_552590 [compost metagenome]